MKIFVIAVENGQYDDRTKENSWVGTDEEDAYKIANETKGETVYFSIWENGKEISEYCRDLDDSNKQAPFYTAWERNFGEVNLRLENK